MRSRARRTRNPVQVIRFGPTSRSSRSGARWCGLCAALKTELAGDAAVWIAGYSNDYTGLHPRPACA